LGPEDPAGAAPAGKHLHLIGDPGAGRVHQVDHRQARVVRLLDDPDDLLDGARAPGAGLDRGVVGHHGDGPAADQRGPGDHPVGRQPVRQRVGEPAVFGERAVVGEQGDPFPGEQLALGRGRLVVPGRAAALYALPNLPEVAHTGIVLDLGPARSTWEGSTRPTMRSASAAASIIASRSTPVDTPMSSTMWTSSSVAMLPVAPGAYGQPPSPPTDASKSATPSSRAASTLARPVPLVLWKCRLRLCSGLASRNAPTSARTRDGVAIPVVSPNELESAPSATARLATATVRSTGTSPSYGQPHAVDTITSR